MKTLTIGNLKDNFSQVLDDIRHGEEITVEYGRKHQKLAVIIPFDKYKYKKRKIGILKGKASFKLSANFKMKDEDFLNPCKF